MSFSRSAIWLVAAAIALKLCLLLMVAPVVAAALPGAYVMAQFPDEYDDIALNLVAGNGYRVYPDTTLTMIREPGYVLLLAFVFLALPGNLTAVQIVNLALSLVVAGCTYSLARRVGLTARASALASALWLFHPATLLAETRGGIEILFTAFACLTLIQAQRLLEERSLGRGVTFGAAVGAACLVKSTLVLLPPFLLATLLARPGSARKRWLRPFALAITAMGLAMSPWVIRNYAVSGRFVPTMTLAGSIAQEGLWATQHGGGADFADTGAVAAERRAALAKAQGLRFRTGFVLKSWHLYFFTPSDEIGFDRRLLSEVVEAYRREPNLLLRTASNNAWRFWFQGRTRKATTLNVLLVAPLLVLAGTGAWVGRTRGYRLEALLLFGLYFFAVHLPLQGLARYHIPLIPVLSVLTAIALDALRMRLAASSHA